MSEGRGSGGRTMTVLRLVLCHCGLAILAFTLIWLQVAETDVSDTPNATV